MILIKFNYSPKLSVWTNPKQSSHIPLLPFETSFQVKAANYDSVSMLNSTKNLLYFTEEFKCYMMQNDENEMEIPTSNFFSVENAFSF